MIVRTKSGNFKADNAMALLDFLGVKKEAEGIQQITEDVELIACIPFQFSIAKETEKELPFNSNGIAWTLSTYDIDRFGERIDPMGWDFKRYIQNPVVEWAHRYDIPAIGKIENLSIDNEGLHGIIVFNDKSFDPFAWSIEQRIKAGSIRAGSVGFRVIEIEIPAASDSKDGTSLIFRKQELLEFSICNVPANPYALAKNIENIKIEQKQDLIQPDYWAGLINNLQGV